MVDAQNRCLNGDFYLTPPPKKKIIKRSHRVDCRQILDIGNALDQKKKAAAAKKERKTKSAAAKKERKAKAAAAKKERKAKVTHRGSHRAARGEGPTGEGPQGALHCVTR